MSKVRRRKALAAMGDEPAEDKPEDLYNESREDGDTCPDCCGTMTWCDSCRMWSKTCCDEYGTCGCS